ncbi:GspE/PulE family protein [Photobacterium leiognathi]|uniref:GspE/PulE family protein n=1 Tax=Photobacterium leiognathi TaxID=553611 RepID=UPI0029822DAE|nr:ATPase, T2SS/T4P/T4SS family [Photobacterium leiognathi]
MFSCQLTKNLFNRLLQNNVINEEVLSKISGQYTRDNTTNPLFLLTEKNGVDMCLLQDFYSKFNIGYKFCSSLTEIEIDEFEYNKLRTLKDGFLKVRKSDNTPLYIVAAPHVVLSNQESFGDKDAEIVLVPPHIIFDLIKSQENDVIAVDDSALDIRNVESQIETLSNIDDIDDNESFGEVENYVRNLLLKAVYMGASDVHLEPFETFFRIRFRLDGVLISIEEASSGVKDPITSYIKIQSSLNIAERRVPQDGRMEVQMQGGAKVDFRTSTLPTLHGEKIVLRLMDSSVLKLGISKLGFSELEYNRYMTALSNPQGLVLVTGPTGSGKSVTLYSGLQVLNTIDKNISTAEDPVEIPVDGINQVPVNDKTGLSYAAALKSFLRQDPDIIMVGEIRDLETASIAVKASQTGHLVLSTLHTNSASATINRLLNIGIEPFNLASCLSLVIAQRLARRLCQNCKVPRTLTFTESEELSTKFTEFNEGDVVYQSSENGCEKCTKGYSGRVGLYEVMPITEEISEAILNGLSEIEIDKIARNNNVLSIYDSGMQKIKSGITTLSEVLRVTSD